MASKEDGPDKDGHVHDLIEMVFGLTAHPKKVKPQKQEKAVTKQSQEHFAFVKKAILKQVDQNADRGDFCARMDELLDALLYFHG